MSQVIVTFVGICTHIRDIRLTPPPDALASHDTSPGRYSRTVLVNGSMGSRVGGQGIPPHNAILYIPPQFVEEAPADMPGLKSIHPDRMSWRMKGVRLYVANAEGSITRTPSFVNVPSLTDRSGRISLDLDPRVVLEGRAAAVFDVFAGDLDAHRPNEQYEAVHGKVTVAVPGTDRELVITRVWDQSTSRIRLKDGLVGELVTPPHVFVMNTGVDADRDVDFLLHYDVTTWSPPVGQPPTPGDVSGIRLATPHEETLLGGLPTGLSIGCSNSNFP